MIKIWFLLVLISAPNTPNVKYNGFFYPHEEACQTARYEFLEAYHQKPLDYKLITKVDAYCLEFESFPIQGLKKPTNDIKA